MKLFLYFRGSGNINKGDKWGGPRSQGAIWSLPESQNPQWRMGDRHKYKHRLKVAHMEDMESWQQGRHTDSHFTI